MRRAEILSAQFNGATLLVLGVLIVIEGVRRLINPPDVHGAAVLIVALIGIVVNLAATWTLARANRTSLNVEGAYQHLLTDLFAFVATAIAGAVVLTTGFAQADGLAALLVAATMLRAAYTLLRESGRIFLEVAPRGLDVDEIGHAIAGARGVVEVHDLHVWEVSSGFPALAAHVVVGRTPRCRWTTRAETCCNSRPRMAHPASAATPTDASQSASRDDSTSTIEAESSLDARGDRAASRPAARRRSRAALRARRPASGHSEPSR